MKPNLTNLIIRNRHEQTLYYDLAQRRTTQQLIVNLRNVTGITTILGICAIIYIKKNTQDRIHRLSQALLEIESTTKKIPLQLQFQEPTALPFYFACPILLSAVGLVPSVITFVTSALYGIYNDMYIETLQQELAKLEQPEYANA